MKLRFGDRAIAYDDVGTGAPGAPVVLLHPFPFDRRYWAQTAPALAPARRVITVDARGFGESPAAGAFAIADLADDLAALLDALGVATATVIGLSMGGYTALAFAHRHAARLAALVLADTRAAADTPETRSARDEARALIESGGAGPYLDRSLPRLLAPDAAPAVLASVRALAETRGDRIIVGLAALRDRPDRTAELAANPLPDAGDWRHARSGGAARGDARHERGDRRCESGSRASSGSTASGTWRTSRRPRRSMRRCARFSTSMRRGRNEAAGHAVRIACATPPRPSPSGSTPPAPRSRSCSARAWAASPTGLEGATVGALCDAARLPRDHGRRPRRTHDRWQPSRAARRCCCACACTDTRAYAAAEVGFGVRVAGTLGVQTLIITNAAGGIDPTLTPGEIVAIADHLNLTGTSALSGPNDERLGPRFVDMTDAYSPALRALAALSAPAALGRPLREAVYAGVAGPAYETPAEVRMLRNAWAPGWSACRRCTK